jgi:plastocyanin
MNRFALAVVAFSMAFFQWAANCAVMGADAGTGSIKGEITANGVRSPEGVVVYIETMPGEQKPPDAPVEVDQKKLTFVPHVQPIVKGTQVIFKNGDPLLHNVFWTASDDGSYPAKNLGTWGQGDKKTYTFDRLGHVGLLCNIHPEMEGYIVVLQNPFFAVVGKDGAYEIKNVPPGNYVVKTWYSKPKKLKSKSEKATVSAGKTAPLDFTLGKS